MRCAPANSRLTRLAAASRRPAALVTGLALAATAAVAGATTATAADNPPGLHDPMGSVRTIAATSQGLLVTGWAADPDARTSDLGVFGVVDGQASTGVVMTSVARPKVQQKYRVGPTSGFALNIPVSRGRHTVCVVARDVGPGVYSVLKCVVTPMGTYLSSSDRAAHDPVGSIRRASASSTAMLLRGWTSDPDYRARRSTVVAYVDGSSAATVGTTGYPTPRPDGAGARSYFDIRIPVSTGTHVGCLWVVNVGIGSNRFLGCRTVDTRGPAGTDPVAPAALTSKVATEARRHVGQPYVWGAVGPRSFDCSGLVVFSYGKFGYSTPRVSQAQRVAARLIPAERAVPGDLVFYHDSVGDVFHVGIYLSPGHTVAAIDTNSGVDYQSIWDPSTTTYGSFTHD